MLICLGFSRPNVIEEDVSNLWIPSDGSYKRDKDYAKSVGADGPDDMSSFAAMALSRHGDNLFKEENLDAIIERMQRIETTPVGFANPTTNRFFITLWLIRMLVLSPINTIVSLTHSSSILSSRTAFLQGSKLYMGRYLSPQWPGHIGRLLHALFEAVTHGLVSGSTLVF